MRAESGLISVFCRHAHPPIRSLHAAYNSARASPVPVRPPQGPSDRLRRSERPGHRRRGDRAGEQRLDERRHSGDVNTIRIGDRTNIQDGTVIHVMRGTHPTRIGHEVTVGHAAMLHGCTIHDRVLIGMGAHAAERRRDRRGLDRGGGHAGARGEEVSRRARC